MGLDILMYVLTTIIGLIIGAFIKSGKEYITSEKIEKEALKMLLQSQLTNLYYVHQELGYIEDYKLKSWYNMFKVYKSLGGNDYIDAIEVKMHDISIKSTSILN